MKLWARLRGLLESAHVWPTPPPQARKAKVQRPRRRPLYTGAGSGTRAAILRVLSDGKPRTRKMISAELDVTSAAIHLPRMVEEGLLVAEYRSRCLSYSLAPPLAADAGDPVAVSQHEPTTTTSTD